MAANATDGRDIKDGLVVERVLKRYPTPSGDLTVLDGITMRIAAGSFVAVVGASGCGKTTLLRIIDGLEPTTEGRVIIDGEEVSRPGADRGVVFQQDLLLPWRTIKRNVAYGLEMRGIRRREAEQRAAPYIELVGLRGFEDHYPHQLSGGMKQRANLARALAIEPRLLLMDEPFASLDAQTRELMQEELLRIWGASEARSVLFITHQIDEAVYLADKVIVLKNRPGRIREEVEVAIPRPRSLEVKRSEEFTGLVEHIWKSIEAEARESFAPLSP